MKQSFNDHWSAYLEAQAQAAIRQEGETDCYELLVDWDGTLRSTYASEGLFSTQDKAENYLTDLVTSGNIHGGWKIVKRIIR